jgi:hypothetical protein
LQQALTPLARRGFAARPRFIADVRDEQMPDPIAGQTLDHGGVGFHWGFDSMGWIRNFSATPL